MLADDSVHPFPKRPGKLIWSILTAIAGLMMIEIPRYYGTPSMKQTVTEMLYRFQMEHYPSPYTHIVWGIAGSILLAISAFLLFRCASRKDISIGIGAYFCFLSAVVVTGVLLRTVHYAQFPYGLWIDNGMAGLHALSALKYREFPIYFHSNYGYEPIIPYMITAAVAALGNTAVAIRLPALCVAILTIFVNIRFTRAWFDRFTTIASTAFLSFSLCHIVLSRQGFRCILMPLFALLIIHSLLKAFKDDSTRHYVYSGIWLGLSIYSYVAIRFFIFVVAVMILHHAITHRIRFLRLVAIFLKVFVPSAVVVAPLMLYFKANSHLFSGRAMSTVVFNQPHPWQELLHNTRQLLGMFFLAGDLQPRHNVAAFPALNPLESFFFIAGLVYIVRRFKETRYAMLLLWMAVMMVPSWITEGAPSFMRLLSMFPAMFLITAVGFREFARRIKGPSVVPIVVLGAVVLFGAVYSQHSLFVVWKNSLETMPDNKRAHYGFCEDEHALSMMFIGDPAPEFILSPQIFLHPTVQFLCYGKKGLILNSDPRDIDSYIKDKKSAVFVFTNVERNLWWLRDNREKDFFFWQKREYDISQKALWDVLHNHYDTHLPVMASDRKLEARLLEVFPNAIVEKTGIFSIVRVQISQQP